MPDASQRGTSSQSRAIVLAVFVTFLWSTSWVLIRVGLQADLPALTFAGLRYVLAFLCLCPMVLLNRAHRSRLVSLSRVEWGQLALLGLLFYTLTQGAQFVALALLPATMLSLVLNLTPAVVALAGGAFLREPPSARQWGGVLLSIVGVTVYFGQSALSQTSVLGLAVALLCLLANAASSVLGRSVNRDGGLSPLLVTFVSMGIGAVLLLVAGVLLQGVGELGWRQWAIIVWLAVVNTALAYTLWNISLQALTAVQSSIINGLMLPQIAILAVLFMSESLSLMQVLGLALVGLAAVVVNLGASTRLPPPAHDKEDTST